MDKKSKILLWVLAIATIVSVGMTFYKTVILSNYQIIEELSEQ